MKENIFKKILHVILSGINGILWFFNLLFTGFKLLFGYIFKGVAFVLVNIGKVVHLFVSKCIKPIINVTKNLFVKFRNVLEKLLQKILKKFEGKGEENELAQKKREE